MPLAVHAIWGAASASTTEHQRRRPRMAGDRAGKHNRRFIGALVERFADSATCFCTRRLACLTAVPVAVTTAGALALARL